MTIKEMNTPFSDGVARIIKEKGLKQVYVAKRAGFTSQELCDMLNGRKLIKACDIPKLANVLGVTVNDIYETGKGGAYAKISIY
ncbi:helix-turn-helix transcriptional regulator [Anaerostipes sp. 494a]|uniref:helix-turn-helix transcriptional regulator n=1 Tax=Anaerostipes sp. 494a TaxID=1261636 RepID=UPI001FA88E2F|nr:helix-turn-helix transcriptional regulator [Anaerostipes sp. 494a]